MAGSFAPRTTTRGRNYRFQFRWAENQLRVRVADQTDVVDIPVEWAFGAGAQAVTFLTRLNPEWYLEHYLTYYSAAKTMAPTPGHQDLPADSLQSSAGLPYKASDPKVGAIGCFECHSTGPVSKSSDGDLQPSEPGVRCEACHGPRSLHSRNPSRQSIRNRKRMSAPELNQFCGRCHRPPAGGSDRIQWSEAWNVRHQPPYLEQSACFRASNGALSCLTCHKPHEPLQREAAFYSQRCESCHAKTPAARPPALPTAGSPVIRNGNPPKAVCLEATPSDCAACHMPRVSPQSYLRFTNHWIGIYDDGGKLKPRR